VWPWIRSAFLFLAGFLTVYPGGIAVGLALNRPPDQTPFALYILLGMGVNLGICAVLMLTRKRLHALAFFAPVVCMLATELLLHI
jgi:hypothetical protein